MKLSELKSLAEKATPGPWEIEKRYDQIWNKEQRLFIGTEDANCSTTQYIAAANPQTILELIAKVEGLSEALSHSMGCSGSCREVANEALEQFGADEELK